MSFFDNFPRTNFHELNLDWFFNKFKALLQEWEQMKIEFDNLNEAFEALRTFVNEYFDNLDVQEEINNKLDEMVEDGSLLLILQPYIKTTTESWLDTHVHPETGYVLDDTLTIQGAAADSEAAGIGDMLKWQSVTNENYSTVMPTVLSVLNEVNYIKIYGISYQLTNSEIIDLPNDYEATSSVLITYPYRSTVRNYSTCLLIGSNGVYYSGMIISGSLTWHKNSEVTRMNVLDDTIVDSNASVYFPNGLGGFTSEYMTDIRLSSGLTEGSISDLPVGYKYGTSYILQYIPARTSNNYYDLYLLYSPSSEILIGMNVLGNLVWHSTRESSRPVFGGTVTTANYETLLPTILGYQTDQYITVFRINYNVTRDMIPDLPTDYVTSSSTLYILPAGATNYNFQTYLLYSNNGNVYMGVKSGNNLAWHTYTSGGNITDYSTGAISMYHRIGVFGDSFSCGSIYDSAGNPVGRHENLSWIADMARRNGCDYKIYGFGGATTKTWLTNTTYGKGLYDSATDKCGLYFLAFGINDSATSSYLGSESDIGTNADTFYGNYSKIIDLIMTKEPNAHLVMLGCGRTGSRYAPFTSAIETIANHYNIPYYDQFDDYYIASGKYDGEMYAGHPTAQGYASLSKAIERMYEIVSYTYSAYFKDYLGVDW